MSAILRIPVLVLLLGLLPLGFLVLARCGGEDVEDGIKVRILTSTEDGAMDGPLYAVALDRPAPRVRLVAVEDGEEGLMVAPGTPDGLYMILSESGWGMLWPGDRQPYLTRRGTPIEIPMGRAGSVYLGARDRARGEVGPDWIVERIDEDGSRHQLAATVTPGFFETTVVRLTARPIPRRVWFSGRMADGRPVQPFEIKLGETSHMRPRLQLVFPARARRFDLDIASFADLDEEGPVPYRLRARGSAFEEARSGAVDPRGVKVPDVAVFGQGIEVRLGPATDGLLYRFDKEQRSRQERADLLWVAPKERVWRLLRVPEGEDRVLDVLVRPGRGTRYVRTQTRRDGDRLLVLTSHGAQAWWVRADGNRWAHVRPAREGPVAVPAWQEGAVVSGVLMARAGSSASVQGMGWRLRFRRLEGGNNPVDLAGAHILVEGAGRFHRELPPGKWTARPTSPQGQPGPEAAFELTPGANSSRNLNARAR